MYKKGSMTTLLVVALLALGVMAFVSFENDASGAFSAPKFGPGPSGPGPIGPKPPIGGAIRPPVVVQPETTYVYDSQPQTTGSDVAQVQLQCYIWKYDHPNVQAPVEIAGLCARFGVTV
jgi:hypothetical protein